MKRIGDILTRNKTCVTVEDGISYKQVTIRTNYKGVVLRGMQVGSTIGTKEQFRVSSGQFILSRIDARSGAFGIIPDELEGAIVTNDFLAFDINKSEVETEFFNVFLQSPIFLEACIRASRGNTNRKRVNEDFFLNYEINLPSLRDQHQLIKRINKARTGISTAQHEITRQQLLLDKLKQAILQEAIQGMLTAHWRAAHPDVVPANQLLQRIKAEKARLIAAKELRPEKLLPQITPKEIPFEIPKGWEWCRLGEVTRFYDYRGKTPTKLTNGVRLITAKNVKFGFFSDVPRDYLSEESYKNHMVRGFPVSGDILFTTEAPLGNACQLEMGGRFALGQRIITIQPLLSHKRFFLLAILSKAIQFQLIEKASGITAKGIKSSRLVQVVFPLPPLAEQKAIVEKVEALMATCHALEAEITHNRTHAAHLLKAVLREAFTPSNIKDEEQIHAC